MVCDAEGRSWIYNILRKCSVTNLHLHTYVTLFFDTLIAPRLVSGGSLNLMTGGALSKEMHFVEVLFYVCGTMAAPIPIAASVVDCISGPEATAQGILCLWQPQPPLPAQPPPCKEK